MYVFILYPSVSEYEYVIKKDTQVWFLHWFLSLNSSLDFNYITLPTLILKALKQCIFLKYFRL